MIDKVKRNPKRVLEPSAGEGHILDVLTTEYYYRSGRERFSADLIRCIEIDEKRQAILRGKNYMVIDYDFLTYSGPDKFDLILMNPPFDRGDEHLMKAIDIIYDGEIVCLLNAETIRNPYDNLRKALKKRLVEINAEIEFIKDGFMDAERKTGVEVALVYINIERSVETDLFNGVTDEAKEADPKLHRTFEVSNGRNVEELVAEYNQCIQIATDTIINYYRNYPKIGKYIGLNRDASSDGTDRTHLMKGQLNQAIHSIRHDFWRRTLELREVRRRMTKKRRAEFEHHLNHYCYMDFTEHNIRQFVLNLIAGYEGTMIEAVLDLFDLFTVKHCYSGGVVEENIHYFNGWKTNKAFYVNKKVIIPCYGGWGAGPFVDEYSKKWKLQYGAVDGLGDIDIVMNYFDGRANYTSIVSALQHSLDTLQQNKNICSTYFTMTAHKKGTLHLTFFDDDILRRFNVCACLGKNWLPMDYGRKAYGEMNREERDVVDSFEGEQSYTENLGKACLTNRPQFLLEA